MDVSALDRGLPAELGHRVTGIARARGSVVVPVIEKKIEEVLKSSSPATCFSDPTVDPRRFVGLATGLIESAEDENALKAASMLMRIDEARFGPMVQMVFLNADGCRNPFIVAYRGLDRRPGDQSTGHRLGRAAIVGQDRLHAPTRAAGLGGSYSRQIRSCCKRCAVGERSDSFAPEAGAIGRHSRRYRSPCDRDFGEADETLKRAKRRACWRRCCLPRRDDQGF